MTKINHTRISITVFSNGSSYVFLSENNNGDSYRSHLWHEADLTPYFRRIWELVKLGGKRTVEVNPYTPQCYTVEGEWWEL
jgi:hypothetical protein